MTTRRKFLTTASVGGAAALAAPAIVQAQSTIKWRFQTYAGGALGEQYRLSRLVLGNGYLDQCPAICCGGGCR